MASTPAFTNIHLIVVPYHVGIQNHRVGAGPQRILSNNLISRLEALHKTIVTTTIGPVDEYEGEIGRSFELIRRVSVAVSTQSKMVCFLSYWQESVTRPLAWLPACLGQTRGWK
jgi:arginase